MILRLSSLALQAILTTGLVQSAFAVEIPTDTPVSSLLVSANQFLAQGNFNDALAFFDAAVLRDPENYLTLFKRGAAYLSLGRNSQATQDFDKVLTIKPDFEGALLQRGKLRAKSGEWAAATSDYQALGEAGKQHVDELEQAQAGSVLAVIASEKEDWEDCVQQAGVAIRIASQHTNLRRLRARCRLEKGEIHEAIGDIQHVLNLAPQIIEPHLQATNLLFYSLGDTDRALTQIRKCLHSDPDSKPCKTLYRRLKKLEKPMKRLSELKEKRQWTATSKLLAGSKEDAGLIADIKADIEQLRADKTLNDKTPMELLGSLLDTACEAYVEVKNSKQADVYCDETEKVVPDSVNVKIHRAEKAIKAESFEEAVRILSDAKEQAPQHGRINGLLNEAHTLLKRSKQKDYYKVLGVARDADDRTIKRAYRQLTKQFHPDKAHVHGFTKEEAQTKMSSINEAYEVISNPELRQRFDNGDDPNSQQQQQPFQGSPFGGHQQFVFQHGGFPGGTFKFPGGGFQFQ
jgi:DnaJ family protein C protein 3